MDSRANTGRRLSGASCSARARRLTFLACAMFTLSVPPLLGQPISPDGLSPGWEQWFDEVPVSGGVRVGVVTEPSPSPVDPQTFTVFLASADRSRICVEVSSKDGRYEARLEYDIAGREAGATAFELPTAFGEQLGSYAGRDLAILTYVGDCGEAPEEYLAATWGGSSDPDTVVVFVNSQVPTFVVGGERGRTDFTYECVPAAGDVAAKAYNKECRVPASVIRPGNSFKVIRRIRKPGGRIEMRPYNLPLRL